MNKYETLNMRSAKKSFRGFKKENPESRKSFRTYVRDVFGKKANTFGKLREILNA